MTQLVSIPGLAATLLQEHSGELILCGASMGGMLAMETVRQAHQRVRGLALLGTTARPDTEAMRACPDARLHLGLVSCPTLVLCGDSDQLTPPECSREIVQLIKGSEFKLVPKCGHMLTMERPAEVNAALLAWLAAIAPVT
jgi:pimeloyl-ACP methyl ester carboxylesterase